jgi:uncharacterized protein YnzC (UPF0291/DUF896 family)
MDMPNNQKFKMLIVDSINNKTYERDATAEEIAQQETDKQNRLLLKTEYEAKKTARINAITKLGQASGLTETEIEAILNG